MRATEFEYRHPTLVRQLIVAAAVSTYLVDPDDVVWRFIKASPSSRELEHALFFFATLLIAAAAVLCTWAHSTSTAASPNPSTAGDGAHSFLWFPQYFGELLFAVGIASLVPLWGAVLLVAGEALRLFRLSRREEMRDQAPELRAALAWGRAFRHEAAKWGILLTMAVFSITLVDRVAEVLAGVTVLLAVILNNPFSRDNT